MVAFLLAFACTSPDDADTTRRARGGDAGDGATDDSGGADTGGVDTGSDDDTGDTPPPETCVATDVRGLCTLSVADHWAAGTAEGVVAAGDALRLASSGLLSGFDDAGVYNGGTYSYGVWTSPEIVPGMGFDAAVPSWNVDTPAGTWIAVRAQARVDGAWTGWYRLGVWASGDGDVVRHSFDGERDAWGEVWTDTVVLEDAADAVKLQVVLFSADGVATPTLRRLSVAVADAGARGTDAGGQAWGVALDVPARSQMVFEAGEAWCSPTSTSMLTAYWAARTQDEALNVSVPEAADGTWDETYQGNGNWPFNVAYAASLGLVGDVGWLGAVSDLEPWIAAGVPVAVSVAWGLGELDNAPIPSTAGHLLVVTGFEADGDVVVNDPAADGDAEVPRVYDRAQFADAWLGGSGGVAYLLWADPAR